MPIAAAIRSAMATALRQLPQQGLPSDVVVPGLLDGLRQCLAPGRQAARPSASRPRAARSDLERAEPPLRRRPCLRRAPGPDRRALHVVAIRTRASRSCSRAGRACPRPSSPRRSPASRRAALRSKSGRCAGRPTSMRHPVHDRVQRPRRLSAGIPEGRSAPRASPAGCKARRLPGYAAARAQVPGRPAARSLGQPAAPLGPGAGAGGRAAGRRSSGSTRISCIRPPR